jgi:hypothetical protein
MNITWSHVIVHRNFAHCLENNFHAISPSPSLHVQYSFIQIFSLKYCNKTNFPSDQFPAMLSHFLQRNFVKSNFCQVSDQTVWPTDCWANGLSDNSFRIMLLLSSVVWKTILLWWWLFVVWPRSYSTDESNTYWLAYANSGTRGTLSADFTSCRGICSIDFKCKINMYIY